jgi:hypothetical protein
MLIIRNPKRWLAVAMLVSLASVFVVAQPANNSGRKGCGWDDDRSGGKRCQQVPDGGSGTGYLLTVGAVCLGALLVRSRRQTSLTA